MPRPTPKEQVDNMLAGIRHTFEAVAVKHIHPWYSWAAVGIVFGLALGIILVANQNAKFNSIRADVLPLQPTGGAITGQLPAENAFIKDLLEIQQEFAVQPTILNVQLGELKPGFGSSKYIQFNPAIVTTVPFSGATASFLYTNLLSFMSGDQPFRLTIVDSSGKHLDSYFTFGGGASIIPPEFAALGATGGTGGTPRSARLPTYCACNATVKAQFYCIEGVTSKAYPELKDILGKNSADNSDVFTITGAAKDVKDGNICKEDSADACSITQCEAAALADAQKKATANCKETAQARAGDAYIVTSSQAASYGEPETTSSKKYCNSKGLPQAIP